ncbi:MAG: acyl-CoA dehydrogenase family protein [Pseudomonadota bacterium]
MAIGFGAEHDAFRANVRDFFAREYPQDLIAKERTAQVITREDQIRSQQALNARGWFGYPWPAEHGGPGWSAVHRYIFEEEMERAGAPSPIPMAIIYIAPVIYTFGSEQQKSRWLPEILESRALWAQGYSEPEAGSDLAALSLEARLEGNRYVLNGTKIWTSYAHWADWIFCLVRTSREVTRQGGITFLCIDMKTPGITVRPIPSLDGLHHLNSVEFAHVEVPVANRIGEEGAGWHYATYLLQNERLSYAHVARKRAHLDDLYARARVTPAPVSGTMLEDVLFASQLAECGIAIEILEMSVLRVLLSDGEANAAQVSTLKIQATELAQKISTLGLELAGAGGAIFPDRKMLSWEMRARLVSPPDAAASAAYLFDRAQTIFGGTTEIQKNLIWRELSNR